MAYFNFKLIESYGLTPTDIMVLTAIVQNRTEDMSKLLEQICDNLDFYEKQGLVKYIHGKKNYSKFKLVRATDKLNNQLENIEIPELTNDDIDLAEWLKGIYLKADKKVGNFKNLKLYLSLFRVHSQIERNWLAFLIKDFINDKDNFEYSQIATNLLWRPDNLFQTKFNLNQSRLYQHYEAKKTWFDSNFEKIEN